MFYRDRQITLYFLLYAATVSCFGCFSTKVANDQVEFALACVAGDFTKVEQSVDLKLVDIDAQNGRIGPCLVSAAYSGHREIIVLLLSRGANIDVRDQNGATALVNAVVGNQYEIVELLIQQGANPHIIVPDESGDLTDITALKIARVKANKEIISLLENYDQQTPK